MILAFIEGGVTLDKTAEGGDAGRRRESRRGSADNISLGLDLVSRAGGENRPVRRGLSKEKKQALTISASSIDEEEEDDGYEPDVESKTADEIDRISKAVK